MAIIIQSAKHRWPGLRLTCACSTVFELEQEDTVRSWEGTSGCGNRYWKTWCPNCGEDVGFSTYMAEEYFRQIGIKKSK